MPTNKPKLESKFFALERVGRRRKAEKTVIIIPHALRIGLSSDDYSNIVRQVYKTNKIGHVLYYGIMEGKTSLRNIFYEDHPDCKDFTGYSNRNIWDLRISGQAISTQNKKRIDRIISHGDYQDIRSKRARIFYESQKLSEILESVFSDLDRIGFSESKGKSLDFLIHDLQVMMRVVSLNATSDEIMLFKKRRHRLNALRIGESLQRLGLRFSEEYTELEESFLPIIEELMEILKSVNDYIPRVISHRMQEEGSETAMVEMSHHYDFKVEQALEKMGFAVYHIVQKEDCRIIQPCGNHSKFEIDELRRIEPSTIFIPEFDGEDILRFRRFIRRADIPHFGSSELTHIRRIGKGAFKTAYELRDEKGNPIALKVVDPEKSSELRERLQNAMRRKNLVEILEEEVRRAERVSRSDHVARVLASAYDSQSNLFFILERYAERTLRHYVEKNSPLDVECAEEWIRQMARGLSAIHREGLFHGDLHPQNILFQNGRILITDLGVIFSGADNAYELAKMPNSQIKAPELFNSIKSENRAVPSQCTDYWAFAVNGLFILDGKFPFSTDFDTSGTGRSWSEISDSEREEFRQNVYKNIQRYHARIMTRLRRGYKYLSEDCRVAIRTGLYINPGKRNNAGKMIEEL